MRALIAVVGLLLAAGCGGNSDSGAPGGGGGNPPGPKPVATVVVSPADLTLNAGQARQMAVSVFDAQGVPLLGRTVTWTSGDISKVTVTSDGVAHAIAAGTAIITAAAEGRNASARIVVPPPPATPPPPPPPPPPYAVVDRVSLNTVLETIEEGSSLQLVATAFDAGNNVITGRGVRWTSSDSGTASVEVDGKVLALRTGIVSVSATIDGRSASATIRVSANWAFDLMYGAADIGVLDELHSLDISDPVARAMPVFPPGRSASHAAPSPDGSRIAFVVYGEWTGGTWPSMIFVADRDGSRSQRLTWNSARNTEPVWSPDGQRIAFTSQNWGEAADIWVMDADGSNAANITADQAGGSKRSPAWSHQPIGGYSRIAYSLESGGTSHVWTMRGDGMDKQLVTDDPGYFDSEPAWSPDGGTLVFQRTGAATFGDLYLVSSTGGPARALMPRNALAHGQFGAAWSPDGRLIAFTSKHQDGEHYQIWTVWSDGTRLAQRTHELRSHSDPVWIMKR